MGDIIFITLIMLYIVKSWYEGHIVLLPEAEAEGNKNDITQVDGLLSQLYNRFPVIKPSISKMAVD